MNPDPHIENTQLPRENAPLVGKRTNVLGEGGQGRAPPGLRARLQHRRRVRGANLKVHLDSL